jgi:phospholipase/carboxylesterase
MRYSAEETRSHITITPDAKVNASVIWLHGLGDSGYGFANIVGELTLPETLAARFIFPHAPERPVTINNGFVMRAWYDIFNPGPGLRRDDAGADRQEDEAGIRDSERSVQSLIAHEVSEGVPPSRIVLAGFSQGGAIVLQTGLRYSERLAGIMALSTYLPLAKSVANEVSPANRDIPILMCHGTNDAMIAEARARASRDALTALGYQIDWRVYPMEHAVHPQEIADISAWLAARLP